MVMIGDLHVF